MSALSSKPLDDAASASSMPSASPSMDSPCPTPRSDHQIRGVSNYAQSAVSASGRTTRVVEVQPLHHGLRMPVGAGRHLRGTARLGDLIERQEALAGALMGRAGGQLTQVFRCLAP